MTTRDRTALVLAIGAITFVEACTPNGASREATSSVTDSAGVSIVVNPAERRPLDLTETLHLGVVDGGGPEEFSQVYAVAMTASRRVAVGNHASRSVRVFDAAGAFLHELAGEGDGPSEIRNVNDVLVVGDTVVAVDWQGAGKAVAFDGEGVFVRAWTLTRADGRRLTPIGRDERGWLVTDQTMGRPPPLAPGQEWRPTMRIHRVAWGEEDPDAAFVERPFYVLYGVDRAEGGVDWGILPERWFDGVDDRGRYFLTDPAEYRIDVHGPEGLELSVRRGFEHVPFTDDDIADIIAQSIHTIDTMSRLPDEYRADQRTQIRERTEAQARLPRPPHVPPIGGLLVSPDGSFWVERGDVHPASRAALRVTFGFGGRVPAEATTWELFGPDGTYVGTVVLPARFRADAVDGRTVVGVRLDDFDVEHVVRYEVVDRRPEG